MPGLRRKLVEGFAGLLGLSANRGTLTAYGSRFEVPLIGDRRVYGHEPWLADVIAKLLETTPGGFIDVGVNLGQTMLKVAAADPTRRYVGFEPNPACADYASELIRANGLDFVVIPAGLGSRPGVLTLQLYSDEGTDPSASLVADFRENARGSRQVVVLAPAQLPEGMLPDPLAIVKIDVEGGEADVIDALEPLLLQRRPWIVVEVLPVYSAGKADRLSRQQRMEDVLARASYRIYRIHRRGDEAIERLEPLETIGIHGDLALCDYIMAPSERADRLLTLFPA